MEDHIQIFIDYKGSADNFGENVLEDSLGYKHNSYSGNYSDRASTVSVKLIERKSLPLDKTPLYLLGSRSLQGYNLAMILLLPKNRSMSSRDIKGHYSWVTQYLEASEIPFKCINPPKEDRKDPNRFRTCKSQLESIAETVNNN